MMGRLRGGGAFFFLVFVIMSSMKYSFGEDTSQLKDVDFVTTYPERLHANRRKRDLSTYNQDGSHDDEASFQVKAYMKNFVLDTKRNKNLLSPSFAVHHFNDDGSEVISREKRNSCHYTGSVRGKTGSMVVLNTCRGLSGLIDDGDEVYYIEPMNEKRGDGAHKVYPARDEQLSFSDSECGTSDNSNSYRRDAGENPRDNHKSHLRRVRRDIDEFYRPYLTTEETRYNELIFVADHRMYLGHNNDTQALTERVIVLANAVDAIYQRANIRIVLVGLEIWSDGDRIPRNKSAGMDLGNFKNYRNKYLVQKFHHDNAHLLSTWGWPGIGGMAYVRATCSKISVGINRWSFGSIIGPYVVLAHEMGHNFGMGHDSGGDNCKCLTPRGCIMGGHKTRVPGFSNCSMISMRKINDKCLFNVPTKNMNAACGNGIREEGEECDCGTPQMCKKDPCCQPYKCKLKIHAQCSDLHHECCENCLFKRQGVLCRAEKSDCDTPEFCTGNSRDCPDNSYIRDGLPCNKTNKLLLGNANKNSGVIRFLSPRIQARYIKINPQHWKSRICLKTELYGCSADEVNPTAPTPLRSYNGFCIQPRDATCNPQDDSDMIYKQQKGTACEQDFKQFTLDSNGELRHHCSGKRVCPKDGSTKQGTKLVVSSKCSEEDSKFQRTPEKSLKHLKSGKCIHPKGGRPGDNREWVLWGSCGSEKIQVWFMKLDCVVPLGLESGKITNSQITASSTYKDYKPEYARFGGKSWCASVGNKHQFLQIDLGKVQTIASIVTKGGGYGNNWVTGYYLEYSTSGQQWKGYSESGDAVHSNSVCYEGTCAESRDTQCRDLWGATAQDGSQGCYDKLNTDNQGFGTCDPATPTPCSAEHVTCGQLQCHDMRSSPLVNYGYDYRKISLDSGEQCSAAKLKLDDSLDTGMVEHGTKCADTKICVDNKCRDISMLGLKSCPVANGKECGGRGICMNNGQCHCDIGYDPSGGCDKPLIARNGHWGPWSKWTKCTKGCDGGKRSRHRFCNNPFPAHGGQGCQGDRIGEDKCNTQTCPVVYSCGHLRQIGQQTNHIYPDGLYPIYPGHSLKPIVAYCDMTRDGGGWTLLVSSHTNRWTADNVGLRNINTPRLDGDYSILDYADSIKDNVNVKGATFDYRLEAQTLGRWGGVWQAPRSYSFSATSNGQTNVKLLAKFDNWEYGDKSIERRMPWTSGAVLTTSASAITNLWGSITGNAKSFHPAPWIGSGSVVEKQPQFIWYWMREGKYEVPGSCMEVQTRGYLMSRPIKSGKYSIKPAGQKEVKTYCDVTRNGGGWSLLVTSASHSGWNQDNVKLRNENAPSLTNDFSILKLADTIKNADTSQEFFQYRIEADGNNHWGGIWQAPSSYSFLSGSDQQTEIKLLQKFDNWNTSGNLGVRMPRLGLSPDILLTSATDLKDPSGSIIYSTSGSQVPTYIKGTKEKPSVVRVWMREGTRRSCNDIKVHGVRVGRTYDDTFYMISPGAPAQYLPVFCDMTSDDGAFTLLITSAQGNWTRAQVPFRNTGRPSLTNDYSILKLGDLIKGLSNAATFKYKLDASQRNHWGGVFTAPISYSFLATNNLQTQVTLVKKFDNWQFSWYKGLNKRMPWFDKKGTHHRALLTTSSSPNDGRESGSIIFGNTMYDPAKWLSYGGMTNPGTIWYWVNEDDCDADRKPINAGFNQWTTWGKCDKECDHSAKEKRTRTCTEPKPRCGGKDCAGALTEERSCYFCPPVGHSCRHLQQLASENNQHFPDGVYKIDPTGKKNPMLAYCDMSRDGGGWTLLVSSHTNTWTADNVKLRNQEAPGLDSDYSVLAHADSINNNPNVKGTTFEYRLEAEHPGQFGGIWEAPRSYTFTATRNNQLAVKLIKKFDNWSYSDTGIEQRMPWVSGARLTTSKSARSRWWGTITGDYKRYRTAPWIKKQMEKPQAIWYWMREGPYGTSSLA